MYAPLARSDYYETSATIWHHRPTTSLPFTRRRDGRHQTASHVHHHPVDERAAQLYPDSLATPTPQAFNVASPHAHVPGGEAPPTPKLGGAYCKPAQIRQVGAGGRVTGRQTLVPLVRRLVLLAGPTPSGSAGASRRCQGCSRPPVRLHGQAALGFTALLRQTGGGVLSPPPGMMAPRGAP
jgi:hypothetical protein